LICIIFFFQFSQNIKQELFIVADGNPISRLGICNAALKNEIYSGASIPNFTGDSDLIDGKKYNIEKVHSKLQWSPKFPSFADFMATDYVNEMSVPLLS
jgi:hypothetical protein